MKRTAIVIVVTSLVLGLIAVLILYYNSSRFNYRYNYNSFFRVFPKDPIRFSNMLDVKYNSYYLAGVTSNHIYLGNSTAPLHLLVMSIQLTDTQHIQLQIERIKQRSATVKVDSPYFYLMDGTMPFIYKGNLNDWYASRYMLDSTYFVEAIPITNSSLALRAMSIEPYENILAKKKLYPPSLELFSNILEKQIDGIFCTDGMLHYNSEIQRLIYIYFYRNQFICMDTSMNILYKANTIDTISHAKIKVGQITSENAITMTSPAFIVNKQSSIFGNQLFIHSNLLSKNENKKKFDEASVIDVYNLKNGVYQFSFYIPNYYKNEMKTFKVLENTLIVLYDHYILTYELNREYFYE